LKNTIKNLALLLTASGIIAIPMSAGTVTWTFDDASATSTGTAGIKLSDNSILTGSFDYTCNSGLSTSCDGSGGPGSLGTFSNVNISVTGGSIIPTSQTWYINQPVDDSGADNQSIFLVNYNPATVADGTNVSGAACPDGNAPNACDPGYLIALSITNDPQIFSLSDGMNDNGGVYLINSSVPPQSGYCVTAECTAVNTSTGFYAGALTNPTEASGHIWANAYVAPTPGDAPEPATMALAGSALLALGFLRRKFASRG